MRYLATPLFIFFALCGNVQAEQLGFAARAVGNQIQFDYRWRDPNAHENTLKFRLPIDDLRRGQAEFRPFNNAAANEASYRAVLDYAAAKSTPDLTISLTRTASGYEINTEGYARPDTDAVMKAHMAAMAALRDTAFRAYISDTLYTQVDETHVMPNHAFIAKRYAPALAPMQVAIARDVRGLDARGVANYIMHFLQSIPYDQLQDRRTSNGAGFQTPYGLLTGNKGDCDTKAVAMAALLRGLFPTLRITILYVPEHAFVGVALPQTPTDYALRLEGTVFVLADPTGPQILRLGQVDSRALADLEAGQYSYREVP